MTTNIQIRVDKNLKLKAEKTLEKIGLDLPTAFRVFLKKINTVGGIPFPLIDEGYFQYSKKQEDDILDTYKHSKRSKPFKNSKEVIAHLRK